MLGVSPQSGNQYAARYDIGLYQLETAVDSHYDPTKVTAIADGILPLVRHPKTGALQLPQDMSPIVEFQILMAIIDRCGSRGGGELLVSKGPFFLTSIFESHLKAGFYSSICQLASLATGIGSEATLHRLAHILEACPSTVLHAVFSTLTTDYQVLCPKSFESVRKLSTLSLPFASTLIQGALLSARQMRLSSFTTEQFSLPWLEVIVEWLCECPRILACSPTGSNNVIISLSNFIVFISTASAVAQTTITNTANSSWLSNINRETLKKLQRIADKLNSSLLLAAFSCQSDLSLEHPTMPKLTSSELTGQSFPLLTEAALMIGVPTLISSLLDLPIVRLLQHIQALRSAGIMLTISCEELQLFCSKFNPQSASKLIEMISSAVMSA